MTSGKPLSLRQQQILEFIIAQIQSRGFAPTVREIVAHVGDKSPTSVHRHLKTLEQRGYITRQPNMSRSIRLTESHRGLALAGTIAAGSPIEAIEDVERIDLATLYDPAEHFMLRVRGNSMIEDHIDDGDLIVVRKQSTCRDGDTVVALIEGQNATLKRLYRDPSGGQVRLVPANADMQPIIVDHNSVEVLGVCVGVIRQVQASQTA